MAVMDFFLGERSMVGFGDEEKTDDPHGFGGALERLTLDPFKKWILEQGQDIKPVYDGFNVNEARKLLGTLQQRVAILEDCVKDKENQL